MKPLVSVCLPVYNAERYLPQCLKSIEDQTYRPLELIIIDDSSKDGSFSILSEFAKGKPWVKVSQNQHNLGVSSTFNHAVSLAQGDYIARMDADDIMDPERIAKQASFLQSHPETVIVGGQCHIIDNSGNIIGKKVFPLKHREILDMLFRTVPMQQPTVTINRSLLPQDFLYGNPYFSPAEDYGLFFSAARYGKLANLPDFTHYYREHGTNISLTKPKFTFWRIWRARLDALLHQHYRPSIKSIVIVLAQTLVILLLPEKLIYPLHKFTRGMGK